MGGYRPLDKKGRSSIAATAAPYISQENLEQDVLEVLRAVALPDGFAEAVDEAVNAKLGRTAAGSRRAALTRLEERQRRLNEMYELQRIARAEYLHLALSSTRSGNPSPPRRRALS